MLLIGESIVRLSNNLMLLRDRRAKKSTDEEMAKLIAVIKFKYS